jgi:hypothetical protein
VAGVEGWFELRDSEVARGESFFLLLDLAVISVREKIPGFGAEPHQKIDVVILQ